MNGDLVTYHRARARSLLQTLASSSRVHGPRPRPSQRRTDLNRYTVRRDRVRASFLLPSNKKSDIVIIFIAHSAVASPTSAPSAPAQPPPPPPPSSSHSPAASSTAAAASPAPPSPAKTAVLRHLQPRSQSAASPPGRTRHQASQGGCLYHVRSLLGGRRSTKSSILSTHSTGDCVILQT